uniref:Uncharacterized protein n=1 Tax=uncultured Desulfobacterium sp. TaxID=201089 RepID=E1YBI1_9BACT|nr:hypothetical protein N47_G32490 [uncultured Desulfobacterium sp.]
MQNEPVTKLEQFLAKKGKLIIKDTHEAGVLNGQYGTKITVDAMTIYEPGKETDKISGLRIEVREGGRLERSNTSFLDMDEVESLSQAISYMITLLGKWQGINREYTEVIFSTKGDFILGIYQKGTKVTAFSKSGIISPASCYFATSDLSTLKVIVDKGNSLLAQ